MRDLRKAMDASGKKMLLTFAAAGWVREFDHIDLEEVMKYADYINLMTYDLSGGNDPYTSHHTNLGFVSQEDMAGTPGDSVMKAEMDTLGPRSSEKIIKFCIDKGVNPSQIVIGSGFYGKGWVGVSPVNNGLYQLAKGPFRGHLSFENLQANFENKNGYTRYWDPVAKAPFLYNSQDSTFITYEDTLSVKLKTEYAVKEHLGGIMFWQLLSDAPENGLLDAIYNEKMRLETKNQ
jgi:chitinase